MLVKLFFKVENEHKGLVELLPLLLFVVLRGMVVSNTVVDGWAHIYDLVLLVESQYFVALVIHHEGLTIVNIPKLAQNNPVKHQNVLLLGESIDYDVVKLAHGSVPDKALDHFWELSDEMSGGDSTNGPSIDSDLSSDLNPVDQKL